MSRHLAREALAQHAEVRSRLLQPLIVDRSFELPVALYAATGTLYLSFIGVMAVGFSDPGLIIPLAICGIFIAMFFAVPAMWVRMKPESAVKELGWDRFHREGISTLTGRLTAGEAAAQMLMLPVLIFLWAIACVTIAALV
jgi:hypothetical protein